MLRRISPRSIIDLARRDLPSPLDVINLITPSRFDRYRWYGLLVLPVMTAVDGRVLWMGRFESSVAGEQQAEKLLVVRYPSQRRFLAMTLNPYYFAINRFREAGVRRFEASFTYASHCDPELSRRRVLVGVHFSSPAGADLLPSVIHAAAEAGAGDVAYATRVVASVSLLDPPEPTDPNPLTYSELALFAPADGELPADGLAGLADALGELGADFSLQVYKREPRSNYRPSFRATPEPAAA